ncbi:MAG: molybdenum cofactor guanylyltransferase [Sulfolobaceae archaeon]
MSYSYSYDAIILAGGLSKRFGFDKCCFTINSKTMLERVVEQFEKPIVVSRSYRKLDNAILVLESGDYRGPIKGLEEGLKYVKKDRVFITGCDFPFLTRNLVDYICSKNYDIVMPITEEPQPLLGCYSTPFLKQNIKKVDRLIDLILFSKHVYFIGTNEIIRADPTLTSLINVNSIVDLILRPIRIYSLSRLIIR